ncbi:MAG TPA: MMPL family transporter [Actinophytocola sp.]|jgi:RND superfamily putative drug exporter|uniref:MMPL family transporter n=1 Tax=Actinophytocola sp. TaxID=1872138 RepID=UPI002E045A06|nr:MMPL family transporter [Actinophytocola sp.]
MNPVTRFAIGRPRLTVAVWVVLAAICVPLMMQLTGALKSGGFENPRGEDTRGQQTLQRAFHEPRQTLQVVLHNPGGDVSGAVDTAAGVAKATPHVSTVLDYRTEPRWLSPNRHTTFLQLGFDADDTTVQNLTGGLRDRLRDPLARLGVQVHVTGAAALDHDLNGQSEKDASTAEMIAFPLLLIVLFLVFRSVVAMLIPLVLAGFALVTASAVGFLITKLTDVSTLYTNAVSIIGLAVAVDYSLFIIKRYRDELAAGMDYEPALQTAMRTAGRSVQFSGLAVVAALLALLIPRMMVFSSIAFAGIVVTVLAMAMSMTLLPAILRLLGRRINWASLKPRARKETRPVPGILAVVHRRPLPLLLILVALFGLLAIPMGLIRLQGPVASATILPSDSDARQGVERLQADLSSRDLFPLQVIVSSSTAADLLRDVRSVESTAKSQPQTHSTQSVASLGLPDDALDAAINGNTGVLPEEARAAFNSLWASDSGRLLSRVVVVPAGGPDSDATHDLVRNLRDRLGGAQVQVTGATAHGVDYDDALVTALPAILGAVALITLGLLARAFRSWRLPLLALFLNAMVVAASVGLLTLISQNALGQRIDSTTPVLLFAIMFGLSMDYMVIMIARMRERFVELGDHREAVLEGMRRTAGLVNGAAVIMVAVFLSFLAAKISVVQQLGLGLAIAVILDAVVVRLLVMPAALYLLGPRVWGRVARVGHRAEPGVTPAEAPVG